jgi:hypothetical protein
MKKSPRFKPGDIVKCVNSDGCPTVSRLLKLGEIYTIKSVDKVFPSFITLEKVHTGISKKSYPVFFSMRFELVKLNPKTKLVNRYYKLNKEMTDIRSKLRAMYIKNPQSCKQCGCIIHWDSTGRIYEETGESLQPCSCYEFMR